MLQHTVQEMCVRYITDKKFSDTYKFSTFFYVLQDQIPFFLLFYTQYSTMTQ